MISGLGAPISALQAFGKKLETSAKNTANIDTDGYKRERVNITQGENGEVRARVEKVNSPGPIVSETTADGVVPVEKSNVDVTREVTNQILAKRGYEANLAAIKTYDELLGSVMDILE